MRLSLLYLSFLIGFSASFSAQAQILLKANWKADGITYRGLISYYDDETASMYVHYTDAGSVQLVSFDLHIQSEVKRGKAFIVAKGSNARLKRPADKEVNYNPNDFYFELTEDGAYFPFITYGRSEVKYLSEFELLSNADLKANYISQFFDTDEAIYQKLIGRNQQADINIYHPNMSYAYAKDAKGNTLFKDKVLPYVLFMNHHPGKTMPKIEELEFTALDDEQSEGKAIVSLATIGEEVLWVSGLDKNIATQKSMFYAGDFLDFQSHPNHPGENYYLTALTYVKGQWLAVLSEHRKHYSERIIKSASFPKDWISSNWKEDRKITTIASDGSNWIVVMHKHYGGTTTELQSWKTSYDWPLEWVTSNWNDGKGINALHGGSDLWGIVMTKQGQGLQTWKASKELPKSWIKSKWSAGYAILQIAYKEGLYKVVMEKNKYEKQSYNTYKF
ncbi:MAG: hypothetical protein OIF50_16315 [Flavobacteriaceae bacterium]|nr:hypothetical protein [Flavobacteriaceae bacterium]